MCFGQLGLLLLVSETSLNEGVEQVQAQWVEKETPRKQGSLQVSLLLPSLKGGL